jgi:hypothetical protein
MVCKWTRNSNWVVPTSVSYGNWHDPKQGEAYDCSFMAALSSVLFVQKPLAIKQTGTGTPRTYQIRFFEYETGKCRDVSVDDWLPSCTSDGDPIWATHRTLNQTTNRNIWPGILEKAYATFCDCKYRNMNCASSIQVTCSDTPKSPTPLSQPADWPCCPASKSIPLFESNVLPIRRLINTSGSKIFVSKDYANSNDFVQEIKNICDDRGKVVNYPAVAWTPDSFPSGSCPTDTLKQGHVYSLLGLCLDSSGNPLDVVFRNPYCIGKNPNGRSGKFFGINVNTGDGIITVKTSDFWTCFTAFGYCY